MALILVFACILGPLFGQSSQGQVRDRRLDEALTEIASLKRLVRDQDRRIADLEKAIKGIQAAGPIISERPTEERTRIAPRPPLLRWQNPVAWSQIREGLSRAQVEEILGKPTSVDAVIDSQTLVYKADPASSMALTGRVKLVDDRVAEITPPPF